MPTVSAAVTCGCRTVSPRQSALSKAPAGSVRCWSMRRECSRSSALPLSLRAAACHSDPVRRQALIRPDDHGIQKLILIDADHDLLIVEEGVGWPTTGTCVQ